MTRLLESAASMKRLAILGGTFNPVHLGHLLLAEAAFSQITLDGVLWMPSPYTHYKPSDDVLDLHHRTEMVRRAIAPHPHFHLAPLTHSVSEPSYAADLFQQLQTHYAATDWYWIVGVDAFQSLPRWRDRERLIQHCTWLVAPRLDLATTSVADVVISELPGTTVLTDWVARQTEGVIQGVADQLVHQGLSPRWRSLHIPLIPISSQLIRRYCQMQQSIRYFVPDAVYQYITTHQLYSAKPFSTP